MHASGKPEFEVKHSAGTGVQPGRKAVILRDVGAPPRLLVTLEDPPMLAGRAVRNPAENRLPAAGENVVSRRTHTEELPQAVGGSALHMGVEPQRGVRANEHSSTQDGVPDADLREGLEPGPGMVEMVGPIEGAATCAEALLAVAERGEASKRGSEVNGGVQKRQPQIEKRIPDAVRGRS